MNSKIPFTPSSKHGFRCTDFHKILEMLEDTKRKFPVPKFFLAV